MKTLIFVLLTALICCASCKRRTVIDPPASYGKPEMLGDPTDITVAFFRFDNGFQTIYVGRLHSRHFSKLATGDYPSVSPSGKFVAYNPEGDHLFTWSGIHPVLVKEVATGRAIQFPSVPKDVAPWPCSAWSTNEQSLFFGVHDFEGNRDKAVVSLVDGSFWRGTEEQFSTRYASSLVFSKTPAGIRVVKSDPDYYGWAGNVIFYQPSAREAIRLTPKEMWISTIFGGPIWIERTQELLFPAVWHSDLTTSGPVEERAAPTPTMYLIKPGAKDWFHASADDWKAAAVFTAEDASCSQ